MIEDGAGRRDEFEGHAQLAGELMHERDVEPDELVALIQECERQRVLQVADAQRPAFQDRVEARARWRLAVGRRFARRTTAATGWCTCMVSRTCVAPGDVCSQLLGDEPRGAEHRDGQCRRDHPVSQEGADAPAQQAGDRAGAEQREGHRVHGGDQAAEARVDDAAREKELERIGGDAKEIQEEGDGRGDAAKQRGQRRRSRAAGSQPGRTIASENHPANRMKLTDKSFPQCGKL